MTQFSQRGQNVQKVKRKMWFAISKLFVLMHSKFASLVRNGIWTCQKCSQICVGFGPIKNVSCKIRRDPKLEGCTFANFGNSSGTEENRVKKERVTGNRTRDPSIIDQMSVLTNQVHLKLQFRHRFDQKCPFTDSLHRLGSRFVRANLVCSTRNNFQVRQYRQQIGQTLILYIFCLMPRCLHVY